jgi:hypothetical protein
MNVSLKSQILELRKKRKTYKFISEVLGCSKAAISYHCANNGLGGNDKRKPLTESEIKELNDFYKNNSIEDCIKKFKLSKSTVIKYTDNKRIEMTEDERKSKNYKRVKTYRQKIKIKAIKYKGGKCNRCGYDKCDWAFEFHHLDSDEKDFGISAYSTLSWDKIKKELDKCILVCANCHREIHYEMYMKK